MKVYLFPAAFLFLLLTACERNSITNDHITDQNARNTTDQYTVAVNGCTGITNVPGAIEMCLDSVVFDNRCPPEVVCITGGEAICRFNVKTTSGAQMITLGISNVGTRGTVYPKEIDIFRMRITLEQLLPVNFGRLYNDYVAHIKVVPI